MSSELTYAPPLSIDHATAELNSLVKPLALALDGRIVDLVDAARYIDQIDFTLLKSKIILDQHEGLAPEWDRAQADAVEVRYKRYLKILRKHEHEALPPTRDIDIFWHAHILDTQAYIRDCAAIYGYYLHHYPYFGVRGESDSQRLLKAGAVTQRMWQDEYGEDLVAYTPAHCLKPTEGRSDTLTEPVISQIPRCARFAT
ncbi:MAG: glycine-rich domain-containing protein-like [Mycobacteriaceae bacterium]|nr:glycine-rich domain-containing protein-like [Mycobacteriaceae bacterium]